MKVYDLHCDTTKSRPLLIFWIGFPRSILSRICSGRMVFPGKS